MSEKIPVAILGATGLVGQKLIALVQRSKKFVVVELSASDRSVGRKFGDVVIWRESDPLDEEVARLQIIEADQIQCRHVISALPAFAAKEIEPQLLERGHLVSSNAAAKRMASDVPLLLPEINPTHIELIERQSSAGKIVTNSNCTTAFIASALKPLMALGELNHISCVTMQAISGAGYPGVDCVDLLNNLIPYIVGEEEKIRAESRKILGAIDKPADFEMTIHVHRVPVMHGHTAVLHLQFAKEVSLESVNQAYLANHNLYKLHTAVDRPQPAREISPYDPFVHIGQIKQGKDCTRVGLTVMGHNLVRGAALSALENLEALINYGQ